MGNMASVFYKYFNDDEVKDDKTEMFEITDDNGYIFCNNYYIPEEILSMILSHLPPKDLVFNGRKVCKCWRNVIDTQVWKIKLARHNLPIRKIHSLPWLTCFWLLVKSSLDRNLLKNNCGQEGLQHWDVMSSGGDGWVIEHPPVGCEDFPKDFSRSEDSEYNSCFATSYYPCKKLQLIDLQKEGATSKFMDKIQPHIEVFEWYSGRFDSSASYGLSVRLFNENNQTVDVFQVRKNVGSADGSSWQKASHVFKNYGSGVRFIEFYHEGVDSVFWKGHYGSKMTRGCVILSVP